MNLGKRLFYGLLTLFHLAPKFAPRAVDIRLLHHLPQWDSNFRDRLVGLHTLEGILHNWGVGAVCRETAAAQVGPIRLHFLADEVLIEIPGRIGIRRGAGNPKRVEEHGRAAAARADRH